MFEENQAKLKRETVFCNETLELTLLASILKIKAFTATKYGQTLDSKWCVVDHW
jgi:hypothetical protein